MVHHDETLLQDHLKKNSALLKQYRQRVKRQNDRLENAWFVGLLSYCQVPQAGTMIVTALQRKYADLLPHDETMCLREIEHRYMQTDVSQIWKWMQWSDIQSATVERQAKRLIHEVQLFKWVCVQNEEKGLAPWPTFVWQKSCSMTGSIPRPMTSATARAAGTPGFSAFKWIQRFRHRWRLQMGRQPVKQELTTESLRDKVFWHMVCKKNKGRSKSGSRLRTKFRTPKQNHTK